MHILTGIDDAMVQIRIRASTNPGPDPTLKKQVRVRKLGTDLCAPENRVRIRPSRELGADPGLKINWVEIKSSLKPGTDLTFNNTEYGSDPQENRIGSDSRESWILIYSTLKTGSRSDPQESWTQIQT